MMHSTSRNKSEPFLFWVRICILVLLKQILF